MKVADLVLHVSLAPGESHRLYTTFKHQGPGAVARQRMECVE